MGRALRCLLLGAAQFRLQSVGDFSRDFAFDRKDISQLAIILIGPKMRIVLCIDQLNVDAHLIGRFLNGAFENMRYAKFLRDLEQITPASSCNVGSTFAK